MPATQKAVGTFVGVNLAASNAGINAAIQSLKVWLFPGPPFEYPAAPAAVTLPQAEVAADQAHFVIYEGFAARNAGGGSVGRGSIDTGPSETAMQRFNSSTVEDLLIAAFPPPGA
jgi:hypothetical protein